ncbi:MAG: asparaginase [Clostridia bacterium]|nr:asparaginase [Clostridia bacterium]
MGGTKKILLILTGGTICSFATEQGEQASDTKKAQALIIQNFRAGDSRYRGEECVEFTSRFPLDTLSENMTVAHWNTLLREMKSYDFSKYDGVIILHGTDTLAYTSAMLSIMLSGTPIPVILVSSQLAIYEREANGNANFKAAVELIVNGIQPNIYAVYRNEESSGEKVIYLHYAAHLLQCANRSNNFYSSDMIPVSQENAMLEGRKSTTEDMPVYGFSELSPCVLKIEPYVGLDYSRISLDGVAAVIHGTYHSCTVAVDTPAEYSIMSLKERCDAHTPKIPLFIEPCERAVYETTGEAIRSGILPIEGLTSEMAYVKTLIGCSIGLEGEKLYDYINTDVNREHLN